MMLRNSAQYLDDLNQVLCNELTWSRQRNRFPKFEDELQEMKRHMSQLNCNLHTIAINLHGEMFEYAGTTMNRVRCPTDRTQSDFCFNNLVRSLLVDFIPSIQEVSMVCHAMGICNL